MVYRNNANISVPEGVEGREVACTEGCIEAYKKAHAIYEEESVEGEIGVVMDMEEELLNAASLIVSAEVELAKSVGHRADVERYMNACHRVLHSYDYYNLIEKFLYVNCIDYDSNKPVDTKEIDPMTRKCMRETASKELQSAADLIVKYEIERLTAVANKEGIQRHIDLCFLLEEANKEYDFLESSIYECTRGTTHREVTV